MVKKMNKNKSIITLTLIAAVIIIALPTTIKIYINHENKLYEVATKKIIESAEDCFKEGICKNHKTTIKELKEKGYLKENIVNPKSKTYFEDEIVLVEENFKVSFQK